MKRVAIFHDYFSVIGGGEKLVMNLARGLKADVITTNVNSDAIKRMGFGDVRTIAIGCNPSKLPLKQINASLIFAMCDFQDKYDFFILSGNWAHYAGLHHHPNLYYCHTPIRAFYDLREVTAKRFPGAGRAAFYLWTSLHRKFDIWSIRHADKIVANSSNVRNRIKKYYGRESEVVYTAVPTSKFRFGSIGDFWLSVNRLYPEKRIDLQLEIFRRLPGEKLRIVGEHCPGDYSEAYTKGLDVPENVEFLGGVDEEELIKLYSGCKGLITTALDEDLGLTPIEAMASGKAVLAVNEGGYRETVVDGKTGWLLPAEAGAFAEKIRKLDNSSLESMKGGCMERAAKFDEKIFLERIKSIIEDEAET